MSFDQPPSVTSRKPVCCDEPHAYVARTGSWTPHEPTFDQQIEAPTVEPSPGSKATRKPNIRTKARQLREWMGGDLAEGLHDGSAAMVPEELIGRVFDPETLEWSAPPWRRGNRPPLAEKFRNEARRVRAELLAWVEVIGEAARTIGGADGVVAFLDLAEQQFSAGGRNRRVLVCEKELHQRTVLSGPGTPPKVAGWTLTWMIREWLVARLEMACDPSLGDEMRPSESVTDIVVRRLYDKNRFPWMKLRGESVWGLDTKKKQPLRDLLRPPSRKK